MRVYNNGCFVTVTVSEREVKDFAAQWPCFGEAGALAFQFDAKNGDLVDLRGDMGMDECGVNALCEDAWKVALSRPFVSRQYNRTQ